MKDTNVSIVLGGLAEQCGIITGGTRNAGSVN